MNYWTELLITFEIFTMLFGIMIVSLVIIAISSVKRTILLGRKK